MKLGTRVRAIGTSTTGVKVGRKTGEIVRQLKQARAVVVQWNDGTFNAMFPKDLQKMDETKVDFERVMTLKANFTRIDEHARAIPTQPKDPKCYLEIREVDGLIEMVDFKCDEYKDLPDEYKNVGNLSFFKTNSAGHTDGNMLVITIPMKMGSAATSSIDKGALLTKDQFKELVFWMMKAGNRLHRIKRGEKGQTKKVGI